MINTESFINRHVGPSENEKDYMLDFIGVKSLDQLIDETIPESIRKKEEFTFPDELSEYECLQKVKRLSSKNKIFRTYIGMGYYGTITPSVILRNVLENPGWYTSYTPYQAEISQGRLEALLNFQTMITDLTAMDISNCSLLDEATATAEAVNMMFQSRSKEQIKDNANIIFVDENIFPQTFDVLLTRTSPLGIEIETGDFKDFTFNPKVFGAVVQYPDGYGKVNDYKAFTMAAHNNNSMVTVITELMSLAMLQPPGEWGADIVTGSTQRFGIPMYFGGPHAAFLACCDKYKRQMPGRIIGVTVDNKNNRALRMALQTREQHIKREKATSNICTAQALLATMAGFYAVYHGQKGIKSIAENIHYKTNALANILKSIGFVELNNNYFDTLKIEIPAQISIDSIKKAATEKKINLRYINRNTIGISIDETTSISDINDLAEIFANVSDLKIQKIDEIPVNNKIEDKFIRTSQFLQNEVFSKYHCETEMMRYIKNLENKDISLNFSMISLGSCTMKLNAATEMLPLSWPEIGAIHPFVPKEQAMGYLSMIKDLENRLSAITGMHYCTLQPNSGAAGEYAGVMVIREYFINKGQSNRNVVLIPASAHGTNPATAVMAGMKVVVVPCDEMGNIDIDALSKIVNEVSSNLAALMVTYPSTHGVFEEKITEICEIIHNNGGQVYMDGANLNAQIGLTSPGNIGADVCHINLHKSFAIPHGGGGPGVGPICVKDHLAPFLPGHPVVSTGGSHAITAVSAAPYGSAGVLAIAYSYLLMLGNKGLTIATEYAILNANYLATALQKAGFKVLYKGEKNRVAHEMIIDCREFKQIAGITELDIAKRLMDYGFHSPTVSFPVHGTLMIEPTESESLAELNRFTSAMISIKKEIEEIAKGDSDKDDNVLKNAPHTALEVTSDEWEHSYSRQKAAYPLEWLKIKKYWPPVGRVNDAYGDRNLVCNCR